MSQEMMSDAMPSEALESQGQLEEQQESSQEQQESAQEGEKQQEEAEKKAEQSLRKKYSLKVNNKIKDIELDLNNDAEIQKYLQKALAADEKFQEAANIKKGFAALIEQIKTDPIAILTHPDIGVDVKALATQVLAKEMEELEKSPEQKRIEELERKLKEKEEYEKKLEEERRQAELAKLEEEAVAELDLQITKALEKSDLPKSPYVVKRIADTMYNAMRLGYSDVTVEQIMPYVEEQITSELQALFDAAPDQTAKKLMEKFVGKKNLDRVRKASLAKAKPTSIKSVPDTGAVPKEKGDKKEEIETISVRNLLGF
jgi:hypothetical protein